MNRFDDFDRDFDNHFRSTKRLALIGMAVQLIIVLAVLSGLGWLAVYAIDAFSG